MIDSKWLRFDERTRPPSQKTTVWWVMARQSDVLLGEIKWYSPWRQYVFFPEAGTLFNRTCLRDLAAFCDEAMAARQTPEPPLPAHA